MAHDVVIRGGTVVDGSGLEPFVADVAVDGDRVSAVGDVAAPGEREIDAGGAIVTPGFIDTHTHFDAQVGWDPMLTPSSWHGVTTVLIGNCGMSFAPVRPDRRDDLAHMMEAVEDIPAETILTGLPWTWESYGEYLDCVEGLQPALNVAGMIGHSALRYYVMGDRAVDEQPDGEELRAMAELVAGAVADGAVGFSTSRFLGHRLPNGRPVPGTFAETDELVTIARALGDRSLFQAVVNFNKLDDEFVMLQAIAEASRSRIFMTAAVSDDPASGRLMRRRIEKLRDAGAALTATMTPRPSGLAISLDGNLMPWRTPAWNRLCTMPAADRLPLLEDAGQRAVLVSEAVASEAWMAPDCLYPIEVDGDVRYMAGAEGSIAALAATRDESAAECFIRLLLESRGKAVFAGRLFNRNLDAIADLLACEYVLPGLGDAGAHVGQVMDAGWTTFFLSHWVRDSGAFTVAEGVRRLTSAPAALLGLDDRGCIAPGAVADLNVIDLSGLQPLPPEYAYDFPRGAGRLVQRARGYRATLVNGAVLVTDDQHTGERRGRVLRGAA